MMCDDAQDVARDVDALIVTHKNELYQQVANDAGSLPVIDVVRLFPEVPASTCYQGIGW